MEETLRTYEQVEALVLADLAAHRGQVVSVSSVVVWDEDYGGSCNHPLDPPVLFRVNEVQDIPNEIVRWMGGVIDPYWAVTPLDSGDPQCVALCEELQRDYFEIDGPTRGLDPADDDLYSTYWEKVESN